MAMVSMQRISIFCLRILLIAMYNSITPAIPETMAEKMNTTGINGDDHQGFDLSEPKMNPTYPCNRKAEGIPIKVTIQPTRSSIASERGLMLLEPSVITR